MSQKLITLKLCMIKGLSCITHLFVPRATNSPIISHILLYLESGFREFFLLTMSNTDSWFCAPLSWLVFVCDCHQIILGSRLWSKNWYDKMRQWLYPSEEQLHFTHRLQATNDNMSTSHIHKELWVSPVCITSVGFYACTDPLYILKGSQIYDCIFNNSLAQVLWEHLTTHQHLLWTLSVITSKLKQHYSAHYVTTYQTY